MKSGKRSILISLIIISFAFWANAERRPIIGISDTYKEATTTVPRSYVNAVLSNGGIPVIIPLMNDENELVELLNSLDGVIFTGGEDYDPTYYNERPIPQMGTINAPRDKFDIKLLQLAAERGIPVLGICRGVQLINIVFGGSLYQDLPTQYHDTSIRHRQRQSSTEASHTVIVEDNTVFADIVKDRTLMVNSSHHQAIKDVAKGFRVAGKSPDKLVEVIEKIDDNNWILGVQFHPEMRVSSDLAMRRIFQRFIAAAGGLENHHRTVKPLIAERPQTARESLQNSQTNVATSVAIPPSQIVYRNVVDTQYVYRMIRDTLYIAAPPDTVYISSTNAKIINAPADTVYFPIPITEYVTGPVDTVYFPIPITEYVNVPADTVYVSVPETKAINIQADTSHIEAADTQHINDIQVDTLHVATSGPINIPTNTPLITMLDTIKPSALYSNLTQHSLEPEPPISINYESDTLIFTPGVIEIPETAKSGSSKSKREGKAKLKNEKKAAKEKETQYRNDLIEKEKEKSNQKSIEQKEQAAKEKFEKKAEKAKEKQLKQRQKENAKIDKKEYKARKKAGQKTEENEE